MVQSVLLGWQILEEKTGMVFDMGIFDVNASDLIENMAEDFKENKAIKKPDFVEFVKTGPNRERTPLNKDWYFFRMASVLYRVYKDGPVGTEGLRTYYGGKKNRGVKPEHFRKAGGKVLRLCLQELEKLDYIKKSKKGRVISGNGEKFLLSKSRDLDKFVELKNQRLEVLRAEKAKRLRLVEMRRRQREDSKKLSGKALTNAEKKASFDARNADAKTAKHSGKK